MAENISMHYLVFPMICMLFYPDIVNTSHLVVAVSQKYQYFKKLETATLSQLIHVCSIPVQASIFLLQPPGLRQTCQEWQTPKWSPSFEKSYPEIKKFFKMITDILCQIQLAYHSNMYIYLVILRFNFSVA